MSLILNGDGIVTGLAVGGLPDGTVDSGTIAADVASKAELDALVTGKVLQVVSTQTRTQGTYSAPTSGDGTELTPLTLTITPTAAGNRVILDWIVNADSHNNIVFIVTRNGTRLTDTTDASNNRWAGIAVPHYDNETASTPENVVIRIIDSNSLDVSSVYKVHTRSAAGSSVTTYLNRSSGSTGADGYETTLSTATATEVAA